MASSKISLTLNKSGLKKLQDDLNRALNTEIDKEMRRRKPTTRAELERVVEAAARRVPSLTLPRGAVKSIVDQWEAKK